MPKIHLLDDLTANQIAAGEVIERPASAVKELVENALDAGAKNINVEIKNGGLSLIRVSDDGSGMSAADVLLAIKRHATSKIRRIADLDSLTTLGFRGEALPSIVSVAKVEIITREAVESHGTRVHIEGNQLLNSEPAGSAVGTTVTVQELFYNTPARRKFLRSEGYESGLVHELMIHFALGHPLVNFRLKHQDKEILNSAGIDELPDLIELFYGHDFKGSLLKVEGNVSIGSIKGYLTLPTTHRANRKAVHFYINNRKVLAWELLKAVEHAYENLLPSGRFPLAVLNISLPSALLDVNVHPGKLEIKIRDNLFSRELSTFLRQQIQQGGEVPDFSIIPGDTLVNSIAPTAGRKINFPSRKSLSVQESFQEFYSWGKDKPWNTEDTITQSLSEPKDSILPDTSVVLAADTVNKYTNISGLAELRIIGQLKATFILAEGEEGLFIIDQHVAHERVIFDRLIKEAREGNIGSQVLLNPITLNLNLLEEEILLEHILALTDLGLILEHFGPHTYLLRAVPACLQSDSQEFFYEVLQELENKSKKLSAADIKKRFLITTSCKSAVKANQKLTPEAMKQLLDDLVKTENPLTCPHGRPIIYKITNHELLKAFQRI